MFYHHFGVVIHHSSLTENVQSVIFIFFSTFYLSLENFMFSIYFGHIHPSFLSPQICAMGNSEEG